MRPFNLCIRSIAARLGNNFFTPRATEKQFRLRAVHQYQRYFAAVNEKDSALNLCIPAETIPDSHVSIDDTEYRTDLKFESTYIEGTVTDSNAYVLIFTCNKCGERSAKKFSKVVSL